MTGTAVDESTQKERSDCGEGWGKPKGIAIQRVIASLAGCKITSTTKGT